MIFHLSKRHWISGPTSSESSNTIHFEGFPSSDQYKGLSGIEEAVLLNHGSREENIQTTYVEL